MPLLQAIRGNAFWGLETLKGKNGIPWHINEINKLLEGDMSAICRTAEERTAKLIRHAAETTRYYRQCRGETELINFPVIKKETIRRNYDGFLSASFAKSALTPVVTSGSYGTPFTFLLTREKKARQLAEVIYFSRWASFEVGVRHALVRISPKSALSKAIHNQVIINPQNLAEEWMEEQRRMLKEQKIRVLIGFPSVVGPLAEYCLSCGDRPVDFYLQGIILMGDPLAELVRDVIQRAFGCLVLSRYATEELGVIAHECPEAKKHHLNMAGYVVELLRLEDDTLVEKGQPGRVVVTDLFSHAMPLIRYETGDIAVESISPCTCGRLLPILERIEGRLVEEIYDSTGRRISPYNISCAMQDMEGIIQFQFVQKGENDYLLRICTLSSFTGEKEIMRRLKKILGMNTGIKIEYVTSIPPLPSGKRPYIINMSPGRDC